MKLKLIVLSCALFICMLASASGEMVVIREYVSNAASGKESVYIWENGNVSELEIPGIHPGSPEKRIESLKQFSELLEKYRKTGYKIIHTTSRTVGSISITEYILEKE